MSVTRINEFQAQEGQGDALLHLLASLMPLLEVSDGCVSHQLLQHQEDPTRIIVIEVWESADAHQAAVKNIPPEAMQQAMMLLAAPPKGGYYAKSNA